MFCLYKLSKILDNLGEARTRDSIFLVLTFVPTVEQMVSIPVRSHMLPGEILEALPTSGKEGEGLVQGTGQARSAPAPLPTIPSSTEERFLSSFHPVKKPSL